MKLRTQFALAAAVALGASLAARAQPPRELNPQDVINAINSGVAYLKSEQRPNGRWDEMTGFQGGVTSLCTLALLNAGVEPTDPSVSKALIYIRNTRPTKTYCVALKIMVLSTASPKRDLPAIQEAVLWLEREQNKGSGLDGGGWSYPGMGADPSNSQFAVLALHEAQKAGVKVSPETWKRAARYWRKNQNGDGSWSYGRDRSPSGSMTCAGIGAMVVIGESTNEGDALVEDGHTVCCVRHTADERLERALAWMGRNFSVARNPTNDPLSRSLQYYYLYALERVGRLSAQRFIGEHDWYREGTSQIVLQQDPLSNYWQGKGNETNPLISTSFSLLFLSKGRRPILISKLDYGKGWNQHRRDAAHMTAVAEKTWRLDLTWQKLDPRGASVDDLLQSPVIYISGDEAASLTRHAKKLRDYVDRGGFIFGEECCKQGGGFDKSFEQLIAQMFPEPEYRLRQLRPAHPIWRMERTVRPDSPYVGKLWAVEYGCRTCIVFSKQDLSCYWELNRPFAKDGYPKAVQTHIQDAEDVGLNVLAYATNRNPIGKEQAFADNTTDPLLEEGQARGVIRIAKLQHGGGCNDAPGALANLTRAAGQGELKLRIAEESPLIGLSDPSLFKFSIAFIHGRHDFRLTEKERDNLRQFLERGGTLLGDSICASEAFTKGFRREILAAMPGHRIERVAPDDPILTNEYGGADIRTVTVRDPQDSDKNQPIAARTLQTRPILEGIKIDGRWAVVFSPYDLSCALEKHEAVECRGYTRQDAARIGLNVLLYAIGY